MNKNSVFSSVYTIFCLLNILCFSPLSWSSPGRELRSQEFNDIIKENMQDEESWRKDLRQKAGMDEEQRLKIRKEMNIDTRNEIRDTEEIVVDTTNENLGHPYGVNNPSPTKPQQKRISKEIKEAESY